MSYPTLAFTDTFTLGTSEVIISKCIGSESAGSGKIPNDIDILAVSICPETTTTNYYIKGIHGSSNWTKVSGEFEINGLAANSYQIARIKSVSGDITMNIFVKGDGTF